jgi:hypothetical protein
MPRQIAAVTCIVRKGCSGPIKLIVNKYELVLGCELDGIAVFQMETPSEDERRSRSLKIEQFAARCSGPANFVVNIYALRFVGKRFDFVLARARSASEDVPMATLIDNSAVKAHQEVTRRAAGALVLSLGVAKRHA